MACRMAWGLERIKKAHLVKFHTWVEDITVHVASLQDFNMVHIKGEFAPLLLGSLFINQSPVPSDGYVVIRIFWIFWFFRSRSKCVQAGPREAG